MSSRSPARAAGHMLITFADIAHIETAIGSRVTVSTIVTDLLRV
jgi:hypothetical protein